MIIIKQERKLINGFRTLNIKDDHLIKSVKRDVLRVLDNKGAEIFLLDIEKDGTISIWSNEVVLHADTEFKNEPKTEK